MRTHADVIRCLFLAPPQSCALIRALVTLIIFWQILGDLSAKRTLVTPLIWCHRARFGPYGRLSFFFVLGVIVQLENDIV